jgi:hypothetical protein
LVEVRDLVLGGCAIGAYEPKQCVDLGTPAPVVELDLLDPRVDRRGMLSQRPCSTSALRIRTCTSWPRRRSSSSMSKAGNVLPADGEW